MGRYYSGNIEGKFWFGTQSSDDATHFGVEPVEQYEYYGCQCCATDNITEDDEENDTLFCRNCYESLEDHLEKTEEERIDNKTYYQGNEIYYDFQQNSLPSIKKEIKKLEKKVGKYMEHFKIIDKTEEAEGIHYEYHVPKEVTLKAGELELIARLCLGRQILFCVETYGGCSFHAEL